MIYIKRKNKAHGLYHLYVDNDTVCRMASTGGLDMKNYNVIEDVTGLKLCNQCYAVAVNRELIVPSNICPHCKGTGRVNEEI
jgi:hypothetical protein